MDYNRVKMEKKGYDARLALSKDGIFWRMTELSYDLLKELVKVSTATLREIDEDMHADAQAENEALNQAEEAGIRQKETDLELLYNMHNVGEI